MATQLFLGTPVVPGGTNADGVSLGGTTYRIPRLPGATSAWDTITEIRTTRDGGFGVCNSVGTVAGPTAGVPSKQMFCSQPLSAAVTISGNITFNIWHKESSMSANCGPQVRVERLQPDGTLTTVIDSEEGVESGTSYSAHNWTGTPTSTAFAIGDRIVITILGNDVGTMASGFTWQYESGGTTAAADGDTYVTFNETITFQTTNPAGTTVKLLADASDVSGSGKKKLWTDAVSGVTSYVTNTANDPTEPQVTDTAGGTALEWYTPQLEAVTLDDLIKVELYGVESNVAANAAWRVKIYKTASDGSSPTLVSDGSSAGEIDTTDGYIRFWLPINTSLTTGQRLMVRVYLTSPGGGATQASGNTATLKVEDNTNPTQITFTETLTEHTAGLSGALGTVTETSTAGGVAMVKGLNPVTETDTAAALGRTKTKALGAVSEVDTAQGVEMRKGLNAVTELDTANGVALVKGINPVTELDTALALGKSRSKVVGAVTELDTAGGVDMRKGLNPASELDTAASLGRTKTKALGQATELDTASTIGRSKTKALGQASEADTAAALGRTHTRALSGATELDTAAGLGRTKTKAIGQASEADTAGTLGRIKTKALGQATELDTAAAMPGSTSGGGHTAALGQVSELDTVAALGRLHTKALGQASELDTAGTLGRLHTRALGAVTELDTASALGRVHTRALGQVAETDTAGVLGRIHTKLLGTAIELDTAGTLGRLHLRALGQAVETDTAGTLGRIHTKVLGLVAELDTAAGLGRAHARALGQVTELDLAGVITIVAATGVPGIVAVRVVLAHDFVANVVPAAGILLKVAEAATLDLTVEAI